MIRLAALLAFAPVDLSAQEVTVAVASNFVPALTALKEDIEVATGAELRVVNGATGKLYAQIVQGAPFDLFLAADTEHVARFLADHPETPHATYAVGQLAKVTRVNAPNLSEARIAIADPMVAPYGRLALDAILETGAALESLALVYGPNVSAVAGFFVSGNVDVAYVSASQISSFAEGEIEIIAGKTIAQDMLLVSETPYSRTVFDYLLSETVQSQLPRFGYRIPEVQP